MKHFFSILYAFAVLGLMGCDNKSANEQYMKDLKLSKVTDYFYEVYYDDYEYEFAEVYNRKTNNPNLGACSSVRNGNFHGRNYDWYYDENVEFIVHTSAKDGRHASVGLATMVPGTSAEFVDSGLYTGGYQILPFRVVDGINDAGVAININVVPFGDMTPTTGTNPDGDNMYFVTAIRYVLDYADSVDSAIELLKSKNLYAMNNGEKHEEGHFMISDKDKTVVVEFVNNEIIVVENANIMTNFYLSVDKTPHSAGLERFDILRDNYGMASTRDGMMSLLKKVWYSLAY
ncbi:MAG: carcinine hydrolase/isopenicillin-N N-acyltransferase family protein, partial [Alphaproteobacteria bacterium]